MEDGEFLMSTVEILFHDSTTVTTLVNVVAIVHGAAAVTIYTGGNIIYTFPWVNVQRIKEVK